MTDICGLRFRATAACLMALAISAILWPSFAQTPTLITESDLHCVGAFRTLDMGTSGTLTTISPTTMRIVNGERRWITFDASGNVVEQREPATLSPCSVDPAQAAQATLVQQWGQFPQVNAANDGVPGKNQAYVFGLGYDQANNWLMPFWTITYSGLPSTGANAFAGAAMDDATKTLKLAGCWGVANTPSPSIAGGAIDVPPDLKAQLPNAWKLIGFGGGTASVGLGISLGPYLQAIQAPVPNACPPGVNSDVPSGVVLSNFPANWNGPTVMVDNARSGPTLGTTPVNPPTVPYHAWTKGCYGSANKYPVDWECWADNGVRHGWFTSDNSIALDGYDDGVKHGIFLVTASSSGWMNTTVLPSPAPTVSYAMYFPTITFSVPDTSTHDGHQLQVGDQLAVETCTVGVDPGCDTDINGRNMSYVIVDTVNQTTGAITGHAWSPDFANHYLPVVGGHVYLGSVYIHGAPIPSRFTGPIAQIYDARQLGEVIAKTRQPYEVRYAEEFDLSKLIPGFGCPGCAIPGMKSVVTANGGGTHYGAQAVFADESRHQIAVVMTHGVYQGGLAAHTIYLLQVGGTAPPNPTPTPLTITCPANISLPSPDGGSVAVKYPPATATGGTPPISIAYSSPGSTLPVTSGSAFPVGDTVVAATATDINSSAGCQFKTTVTYTAPTPDTTPPSITEFSVTPKGLGGQYAIHARVTDNIQVSRIRLRVNGTIRKTCLAVDVCDLNTKTLVSGSNLVRSEASDAAMNTATRDQIVIR